MTDADLVLGRLDPGNFLGGAMRPDPDAVRRAVGDLAGRLGLGLEEAAEGIVTAVNAYMANALGADRAIDEGVTARLRRAMMSRPDTGGK